MNSRRRTFFLLRAGRLLALVISAIASSAPALVAQQFATLVSFTNVWRYDRSGTDLGTAWRTNDYDDSAWEEGQGLLGAETTPQVYAQHAPILTPLTVPSTVTTFYFRTTFEFNGSMEGLRLFATNLVDDGCAIYLNGELAGGVRMPEVFDATTTFPGPATEGQLDVVELTLTNLLRIGPNQLAVEVHQAVPTSTDVMFGVKLIAVNELPLVITNQPQSYRVTVGDTVTMAVGVSGGPVAYRWQKDGINLLSTSNSFSIANAQLANSGNYTVICSNSLTVVTSSVAVLSVLQKLSGPKPVIAIADNGYGPRSILVQFSEVLSAPTARDVASYRVTELGTGALIQVTNVLYSGGLGALLRLDAGDTNWVPFGEYQVTINNVTDQNGNAIAPNTRVAVTWEYPINLVSATQSWDFHDSAIFDPGVYDEPWFASDYEPSPWWGQGQGGFFAGPTTSYPCPQLASPQVPISWQPEPTLFRTPFQWPEDWPSSGKLRIRHGADDGLVVYLNGNELYRYNVVGIAGSKITAESLAITQASPSAPCITNVTLNVSGLGPGTNWLAVAVVQAPADFQNSYFVFDVTGSVFLGPALPPEPLPVLEAAPLPNQTVQLSWTGSGYSLEASTSLDAGSLSYPAGPWTPVPQMSNPYLWSLTNGSPVYFRLKK